MNDQTPPKPGSPEDIRNRLESEEDFINHPKFENSIRKFLIRHPDGVDNAAIARVLMTTEEDVEALFESALAKLREAMCDE